MEWWAWLIIIAVVVIVAIAVVAAAARQRKQRTEHLRERFGPEYDRTMRARGSTQKAEAELAGREQRREKLDIRPLHPTSRERYASQWEDVQARFVDSPDSAVHQAHELVQQVMRERGYPVDDFDRRQADISVDYPDIVENYRSAHQISVASDDHRASTEDLRQAMVHYRTLFSALLQEHGEQPGVGRATGEPGVGSEGRVAGEPGVEPEGRVTGEPGAEPEGPAPPVDLRPERQKRS